MNDKPSQFISKILSRKTSVEANIFGSKILASKNVLPPGKLAKFFLETLITQIDIKNKYIADVGAGCLTIGHSIIQTWR